MDATPVLIALHDSTMRRTLATVLHDGGYEALPAADGRHALALAAARRPDLVVLDIDMPDADGLELIANLRGWTSVPIIALSAGAGEAEKVAALDAGASDYLTKPFGIAELMARIRAALRTKQAEREQPAIITPDFTLDLAARRARRGDDDVQLTQIEWEIVRFLARNPGRLVTQAQLLEHVWGLTGVKNNYVRVYLAAIRRKLEPDPAHPRYFRTEHRAGIRFTTTDP